MKLAFFTRSLGFRSWQMSVVCVLFLISNVIVVSATDSLSSWNGSVTFAPNIDATNFYNSGAWDIFVTPKPFMTASTLNYTNIGSMDSTVGWEFDWGPSGSGNAGPRSWASIFFNDALGSISAESSIGTFLQYEPVGYLWISATNIINKGYLSADAYSEVKLNGSNIDIHRSVIEIEPLSGVGSGNNFVDGNFTSDQGVFDLYWEQAGFTNAVSSTFWNGTNASSPVFRVGAPCGVTNLGESISFPVSANYSDSINFSNHFYTVTVTNASGNPEDIVLASNEIRQAVFIYTSDSNITAQVRFSPSTIPTNDYQTVAVQLAAPYIDFLTASTKTNFLYLVDRLASQTNRGVLPDLTINPYSDCSDTTYRPANYILSRVDPGAFRNGSPGLGAPVSTFLYESDFTNVLASGEDAAYSAQIDNQAFPMPFASVTNLPGRFQLKANNLNLSQARIRGEGSVIIQASNLVSSVGAYVDCQNLSYDLGATNGYLVFTNLARPTVNRFYGNISCWSGVWQNNRDIILTNYTMSTNGMPQPNLITNSMTEDLYVLLVNAGGLSTTAGVTVQNLALHSTNIVMGDTIDVANSLLFDGESLTLDGGLNLLSSSYLIGTNYLGYGYNPGLFNNLLESPINSWTYELAPKLRYFTNNSSLFVQSDAHFGDDGPTNYLTFVNNGSIYTSGQIINADYIQLNGFNYTTAGNFSANFDMAEVTGAYIFSSRDIDFTGNTIAFNYANLSSQNMLNFNITGSLSDGGFGTTNASNSFYCQNGFNLWTKPASGDLLGTILTTVAYYGGAEVDHHWAGANYGNSTAGYQNNVALGTLSLSPLGSTNLFEPLFRFYGTAGTPDGNAMYVSNLDLSMLTDFQNEIEIDPSLDIYYMTASLDGTNGAEQVLDGQFNNHLHWVQGVVTSAPPVIASSQRFQLSVNYTSPKSFQIGNVIMPSQTNIIEASTDLVHWTPIYTNIGSYTNIGPTTISDPNAKDFPNRFYRAVPAP